MLLARTMGHELVFKPGIMRSVVLGLPIDGILFGTVSQVWHNEAVFINALLCHYSSGQE